MAIKKPLICEIAKDTWLIDEFGCNNMYILKGRDKSLVIDAGMGYCNFREIVESLVGKDYYVAITHADPDHIGMMHQFDKIYMHPKEIGERFKRNTRLEFNLDEFHWNNDQHLGNWEVWEVTEDMINRGKLDTEIEFIDDGYVFDLGNRKIASYHFPGHGEGHLYFIDDYSRIAFTGDCVNHNNGTNCTAVSTHIRNLKRLLEGYGKTYDRIFTGHSTYCGNLNVVSHNINIVRNLINVYTSLLQGDAKYSEIPNHLHPERPPRRVVVYGRDNAGHDVITHSDNPLVTPGFPEKLWEAGEEHIIP
jgi:glyoxylase-like metal-dependent hydrolase (beta-lactamase superfamily II)